MKKILDITRNGFLITGLLTLPSLTDVRAVNNVETVSVEDSHHNKPAPLTLPTDLPEIPEDAREVVLYASNGRKVVSTLDPQLERSLQQFILKQPHNPIVSVVLVEAKSGRILALTQGRDPKKWGANVHTGLYPGFPAASVFKLVSTAASIEVVHIDPNIDMSPADRCATINPHPSWLNNFAPGNGSISLENAFARSCNSFYSKLGVKYVGIGLLERFARKFGWGSVIPADFHIPLSPIDIPVPETSTMQTVGSFAAGFGRVGLSTVHAAWFSLLIANNGRPLPLRITRDDTIPLTNQLDDNSIIDAETSLQIRQMMKATVMTGTAHKAFGGKRYKMIRHLAGGKTGSLSSLELKSQEISPRVTWFVGLMPYDNPEVVVSAVAVAEDYHHTGAFFAAEALYQWYQLNYGKANARLSSSSSH